jgi:hypothetical protein
MTECAYPGDEVVRQAFARKILKIIKEKGLTIEEFERRVAAIADGVAFLDHREMANW